MEVDADEAEVAKWYICKYCLRAFESKNDLGEHKDLEHQDKILTNEKPLVEVDSNSESEPEDGCFVNPTTKSRSQTEKGRSAGARAKVEDQQHQVTPGNTPNPKPGKSKSRRTEERKSDLKSPAVRKLNFGISAQKNISPAPESEEIVTR